jgi:tRNA (guanine6-N2)-methyltransferase
MPPRRPRPRRASSERPASPGERYEAEVLPGLAPFAAAELEAVGAETLRAEEDSVSFVHRGDPTGLLGLRRCVAVYAVLAFDVPRPKALLGHANLARLASAIERVLRRSPAGEFSGFRFGAAGSDSPVFQRLAQELSAATGIPQREEGELLLRVRPGKGGGWEVLIRLTPRPLSARSWRACNRPGGLNASVAAAGHDLLGVAGDDSYLNLMCGSGTLLIERALAGGWRRGVGVDIDPAAVECARENLARAAEDTASPGRGPSGREKPAGSNPAGTAELVRADATALPFEAGGFDRLSADLPWGDVIGDHARNAELYPLFLTEAARVSAPGARLLAITHELRLFDRALSGQSAWRHARTVRVFHGGHRPGLYLLELA